VFCDSQALLIMEEAKVPKTPAPSLRGGHRMSSSELWYPCASGGMEDPEEGDGGGKGPKLRVGRRGPQGEVTAGKLLSLFFCSS
jgi:hypothetical protein